MRWTRRATALVVVGVLTACASGSTTTGATPNNNGTLTIAVSKAVGNLNPFKYKAIFNAQTMVFDPLVQYGPDGKILPALAQSWTTSSDGRTVTFHLRPNVQFSDGSPWNAATALLSLKKWVADPGVADFLGAAGAIGSVDAPDDMTLVMHLKQPYAPLLQDLTIVRPVRFLGKAGFDASGAYQTPIGTGPFKLVSDSDTQTVFARNDKYWGPKPKVSQVVLKVIPDAQTRLAAVGSGDVDLIGGDFTAPITPQQASTLKSANGVHLVTGSGTATLLIAFNYMPGHLTTNLAVRKAITLAVDRAALTKSRLQGFAQPAGGFYPAAVPLNDASTPVPAANPKAAQDALTADGWTGTGTRKKGSTNLSVTFLVSDEVSPGSQAIAEIVQSELKPVGINVDISSVDHATYHDAVPAGKYDLTLFETIGAPYDPLTTLTNYFVSTLNPSEGRIWMDQKSLDPLVAAVVAAQSDAERKTAYDNVYRFFRDQAAVLPLAYPSRIWASGKRVHDVSLAPTDYDFPLHGVWVS
ncbi:MAG: ABC transporter substrate-binding protein [Candidatus Dormibacter sp.]|uniref:ABC transporter substrate-binding protein n=1 Tax=Candidatus Dormibacter sp. TaxID=2973982 RepID=UPI000DB53262|nr:MAG: nickel ABC transporter substrate-binding protein [Candidatus Dormibacteraeota bacterium]